MTQSLKTSWWPRSTIREPGPPQIALQSVNLEPLLCSVSDGEAWTSPSERTLRAVPVTLLLAQRSLTPTVRVCYSAPPLRVAELKNPFGLFTSRAALPVDQPYGCVLHAALPLDQSHGRVFSSWVCPGSLNQPATVFRQCIGSIGSVGSVGGDVHFIL